MRTLKIGDVLMNNLRVMENKFVTVDQIEGEEAITSAGTKVSIYPIEGGWEDGCHPEFDSRATYSISSQEVKTSHEYNVKRCEVRQWFEMVTRNEQEMINVYDAYHKNISKDEK